MPQGLPPGERLSFLSRDIDFDAQQLVRAAGALLGFLRKNNVINQLEDPNAPLPITQINNFSLCVLPTFWLRSTLNMSMPDGRLSRSMPAPSKRCISLR